MGIMIWQDFMFACAEYPDHLQWFRELANREVRENVIKLRHHIALGLQMWTFITTTSVGRGAPPHGALIMGILISIVPFILAFILLRKYWQPDLSLGTVKG